MSVNDDSHGRFYWLLALIGGVLLLAGSLYARAWVAAAICAVALQGVISEWLGFNWRQGWSKTQRFVVDLAVLLFLMTIVVVSRGYVDITAIALALLVTLGWLVWRTRKLQREK